MAQPTSTDFARKIVALALSALAAKLALSIIDRAWTKGLGKTSPRSSNDASVSETLIWTALTAGAVALAREAIKQTLVPKRSS